MHNIRFTLMSACESTVCVMCVHGPCVCVSVHMYLCVHECVCTYICVCVHVCVWCP